MPPGRKRRSTTATKEINNSLASDGPFNRGSIVRVRLRNFMTYRDIELRSGPYLNMVLGPNGTGKSALVCAMIVGLAGDASTTGRAGSFNEYVKFGADSATVEIELYNLDSNYIVERKLVLSSDRKKCSSEWRLNGTPATQAQVKALIASLNIRVNNLCQFLPQERVVEFCRMNPQQLLENTEKAAGDEDMFADHEKLKELSKEITSLKNRKGFLVQQLATEEDLNQRMAQQVERVRERKEYEEKLSWLEKKKPWIEYEEYRKRYEDSKKALEKAEKVLAKNKAQNAPLEAKVANFQERYREAERANRVSSEKIEPSMRAANKIKSDIDSTVEMINASIADLDAKKNSEAQRIEQVKTIQEEISMLKQKLDSLVQVDVTEELRQIQSEIDRTSQELHRMSSEKDERIQNLEQGKDEARKKREKLNRIENVFKQRMDLLQRTNSPAYNAAVWLEQNKNQFRRKIFPPIMTQINVKKSEWVSYVENSIPFRDLVAFVCEDVKDYQKFSLAMKQNGFRVNIVQAPEDIRMEPRIPISRLNKYGFTHYLNQLFSAPQPIMEYLCQTYNLNNLPIGDESVNADDFLASDIRIGRFYCGSSSYSVSVSKYDGAKITLTDKLRDPRLLNLRLDEEAKKELTITLERLQQKIEEFDQSIKQIDNDIRKEKVSYDELRQKKRELLLKKDEKKVLTTKIEAKEENLARKEHEKIDLATEKEKACRVINSYFKKRVELITKYNEAILKILDLNRTKMSSNIVCLITKKAFDKAKNDLNRANKEFASLEVEIKRLKEDKDIRLTEARQKRAIFQKAVKISDSELPKKIKEIFRTIPDTLDEVESEMRQLTLRMESLGDGDDAVLREFDEATNAIKKKKHELEEISAELNMKKRTLDATKSRWLPPLKELVDRTAKNFSKFMASLGCAGDVLLSFNPSDEDDFSAYGISIKVKYRDTEELKELSAFHQSGGERSVATMIYMIALQELTKVPFRIVDEINQGMDDTNERRVFDLIVETASSNSSQYFLFSPKLLQGLKYTDRMHIHIIYNGPRLAIDWDKHKLMASR